MYVSHSAPPASRLLTVRIQTEVVALLEPCALKRHHAFNARAVTVLAQVVRSFAARRPAASHMTDDDLNREASEKLGIDCNVRAYAEQHWHKAARPSR
jgi:hypothetical protein